MQEHVKILAILNLVYRGLGVLIMIVLLLIFGGTAGLVIADHDPDAATAVPILGAIGGVAIICVGLFSVPPFVAGIGLLKYRPWARTWAIIAAVSELLSIPFGTALGIYGLWVMFKDETAAVIKAKNPA